MKERGKRLDSGGKFAWAEPAVDVILRGQSDGTAEIARLLLGDDRLLRVNPTVPPTWEVLDVMREDDFASRAWQGSKESAPKVAQMFLQHAGRNLTQLRALGDAAAEEQTNGAR